MGTVPHLRPQIAARWRAQLETGIGAKESVSHLGDSKCPAWAIVAVTL
ncbi:hypothetical protein [Novosphingobium sp.]